MITLATFSPDAIAAFLQEKKDSGRIKPYELTVALVLCQFCQMQFAGQPCEIGFELESTYSRKRTYKNVTLNEIADIFAKQVMQDSPIDIAIACKEIAVPFQLKRFGKQNPKSTDEELSAFINEMKKKYARSVVTRLVIILECECVFDLDRVTQMLHMGNFPFSSVMYISLDSRTGHLWIGEIWPKRGCDEYELHNGRLIKLPV